MYTSQIEIVLCRKNGRGRELDGGVGRICNVTQKGWFAQQQKKKRMNRIIPKEKKKRKGRVGGGHEVANGWRGE